MRPAKMRKHHPEGQQASGDSYVVRMVRTPTSGIIKYLSGHHISTREFDQLSMNLFTHSLVLKLFVGNKVDL